MKVAKFKERPQDDGRRMCMAYDANNPPAVGDVVRVNGQEYEVESVEELSGPDGKD
jgi:hypothetical protein